MNFSQILEYITSNANIDKETIFNIVDQVKHADLSNEMVLRKLIRDIAKIANRPVSKELEDRLVNKIKNEGIPSNLSDLF